MDISTITLIGMPGVGKSTVGVLLAKRLGLNFVDTDLLIQVREGETLQRTLEQRGYLALRDIEETVILEMPLSQSLISTGGSAVYSQSAMERLSSAGPIVYLRSTLPILEQRVAKNPDRGIASPPGVTLSDVFEERAPLYAQYGHYTVDCDASAPEDIASTVMGMLASGGGA